MTCTAPSGPTVLSTLTRVPDPAPASLTCPAALAAPAAALALREYAPLGSVSSPEGIVGWFASTKKGYATGTGCWRPTASVPGSERTFDPGQGSEANDRAWPVESTTAS